MNADPNHYCFRTTTCAAPGLCGECSYVCNPCHAARTAPPHETAPCAPEQSPNPVGASAQSDEYRASNTLSVTLGDLGFVFALGVIFGVVGCLEVAS